LKAIYNPPLGPLREKATRRDVSDQSGLPARVPCH
jgi:hypothetical protein